MPPTIPPASHSEIAQATSSLSELRALIQGVGTAPLPEIGWIKVTGEDRVRWLNGMVTNSVQDLTPGAGCYNFILNAQGRIQGDAYAFARPDHLLLQTGLPQLATLMSLLDRFIIMDDVELADISDLRKGLLIAGSHAPDLLNALSLRPPADPAPCLVDLSWRDRPVTLIHAYSPLVPRFELWSDQETVDLLSVEIVAHNATPCTPSALDLLRICEGTPLFGVDIRDRDLPQETGANRALHFSKGCYLGQEIVERIRSRGSVHRTFGGFRLHGQPASAGLPLSVDEKPVGELTGVARLQTTSGEVQIALGYIRREALAQGKPISYGGGLAQPAPLPFDTAQIL